MSFERQVTISPAFDKRHSDPAKNYGIGSCVLRMILRGERGATQFVMATGWHLRHVSRELADKGRAMEPMGYDVGYHSPFPIYDGQASHKCDVLDGGQCYYDGSSLQAEEVMRDLLREGHEAVWNRLQSYYESMFGEEE